MALVDEDKIREDSFAHRIMSQSKVEESKRRASILGRFYNGVPEGERQVPKEVARCRSCTGSLVRGPEAVPPILDESKI